VRALAGAADLVSGTGDNEEALALLQRADALRDAAEREDPVAVALLHFILGNVCTGV
jgi:hypothetical protein